MALEVGEKGSVVLQQLCSSGFLQYFDSLMDSLVMDEEPVNEWGVNIRTYYFLLGKYQVNEAVTFFFDNVFSYDFPILHHVSARRV